MMGQSQCHYIQAAGKKSFTDRPTICMIEENFFIERSFPISRPKSADENSVIRTMVLRVS